MNVWFQNGGHQLVYNPLRIPVGHQVHKWILEVRKFEDDTAFQLVAEPDAFSRSQLQDFIKNKLVGTEGRLLDYYGGGEDVIQAMRYKWGLFESDFGDNGIASLADFARTIQTLWSGNYYEIPLEV